MKILCIVFAVVLAAAKLPAVATTASDILVQQVLAVERERVDALDRSDVAALDRIMSNDVTYVHASGRIDSKESYLGAIRSGQLHYISWKAADLRVRVAGDAAILTGRYAVRVSDTRVQPQPFDVDILVLSVYARRDGRWRQIAWQSTRVTPASRSK